MQTYGLSDGTAKRALGALRGGVDRDDQRPWFLHSRAGMTTAKRTPTKSSTGRLVSTGDRY